MTEKTICISALQGFCSLHPSNWIWFAEWALLTADAAKPFWQLPDYQRLFNGRWHLSRLTVFICSAESRPFSSGHVDAPHRDSSVTLMFHCTARMNARADAHMVHVRFSWPLSASQGHLFLMVPHGSNCVEESRWHWLQSRLLSYCIFQQLYGQLYVHIGLNGGLCGLCSIVWVYQEPAWRVPQTDNHVILCTAKYIRTSKAPPDSRFVHSHGGVDGLLHFDWEEKPAPLTDRLQVNKCRATGNNPKMSDKDTYQRDIAGMTRACSRLSGQNIRVLMCEVGL